MILLLDAGNSRIKWRVVDTGGMVAQGVCATDQAERLRDEWARLPLVGAMLICVAGDKVAARLARFTGLAPGKVHRVIPTRNGHGLVNTYLLPERLGVDRYAALVAACRLELGDCIVAGVGTALTADMLTREGIFLGGCIVPGPELMSAALVEGTSQIGTALPPMEVMGSGSFEDYPRETAAAIRSGIVLALAGVIVGMRVRLERDCGRSARIVLTGGAREQVRTALTGDVMEMDNMVLEGATWIARDLGYDV